MNPLTLDDIVDLERYESARPAYRARILAHKEVRRISVGDRVTLLFEDRETLRYQILEMARAERTRAPERLQQELDVYNELVPGERELSSTLFIEIPELDRIRPELDRLLGIDECVSLVLGEGENEERATADFDRSQLEEDRISAVHYLRFRLTPEQVERFARGDRARLRVHHPAYTHETDLEEQTRRSLLADLRGAPPLLMDPAPMPGGAAKDELLLETEAIRAYRPARALAAEHVVVEPRAQGASLLTADDALQAELLRAVREIAAGIVERRGHCRVWTDVDSDGASALRWHVASRSS